MLTADQNRKIIAIASGVIFVFIGFTYYYFWISETSIVETTKFSNFCTTLSFLGIILGFTVMALDYCKDRDHMEKEDLNTKVKECQTNWIELEKLFISQYPYLDRLYGQMYPSHPEMKDIKLKLTDDEWRKVRVLEVHVCSILFQCIENICTYGDPDHLHEWVLVWKSWFQSKIVRRQWSVMRQFYTQSTQLWVDQHIMPLHPRRRPVSMTNSNQEPKSQMRNEQPNVNTSNIASKKAQRQLEKLPRQLEKLPRQLEKLPPPKNSGLKENYISL
jgi:hypothetical protein